MQVCRPARRTRARGKVESYSYRGGGGWVGRGNAARSQCAAIHTTYCMP